MGSTSEKVLHQVNHVKYKKDIGSLYLMQERLIWLQENREVVTVSHLYSDIKSQKISPEGKAKIQLQIVLLDNTTYTFHFVDPNGPGVQISNRNYVRDCLSELIQKFKRRIDPEIEHKNRLLIENPGLLQLYKELVITEIVKAPDFWNIYAKDYVSKIPKEEKQETGVSSGFLTCIQSSTDGVNGIAYNLTSELMQSIFKTYPAVLKKHKELVPEIMSEKDFWAKFFQSHYFHRDRLPLSKDVFYSCAKSDDREMRRGVESLRQVNNDIISMIDDPEKPSTDLTTIEEPVTTGKKSDSLAGVTPHRNMIKRFNQHSIMILKACEKPKPIPANSLSQEQAPAPEEPPKKKSKKDVDVVDTGVVVKPKTAEELEIETAKLLKKIQLDDLKDVPTSHYKELNVTKMNRYLNGPIPIYETEKLTKDELARSVNNLRTFVSAHWTGKPALLDHKTALNLVQDLSPAGAVMKSNSSNSASTLLPEEVHREVKSTYGALNELLRHFWQHFPPVGSNQLERDKIETTFTAIKKFEQIRLKQLHDRFTRDHLPLTFLDHMSNQIAAAERKFSNKRTTINR